MAQRHTQVVFFQYTTFIGYDTHDPAKLTEVIYIYPSHGKTHKQMHQTGVRYE